MLQKGAHMCIYKCKIVYYTHIIILSKGTGGGRRELRHENLSPRSWNRWRVKLNKYLLAKSFFTGQMYACISSGVCLLHRSMKNMRDSVELTFEFTEE